MAINISNVSDLYAAVNDPANAGKRIVLAPDIYKLRAINPDGSVNPNAGRLELQHDMELRGQKNHSHLVTIDASQLPDTSFKPPAVSGAPLKTGPIRLGRGSNAVEWLTILGNPSPLALSAIDTDLPSDKADVKITNVIIKESQIGIDIRNFGVNSVGRIIKAEIHNNELTGNLVGAGQGIIIQNSNGAKGSIIEVNMSKNNIYGNRIGCRIWNLASLGTDTDANSITIQCDDDQFNGNGVGIFISAGAGTQLNAGAKENFISLKTKDTSILNNGNNPLLNQMDPKQPVGGICIVGGLSVVMANTINNNKVEIKFHETKITGNAPIDINAYGAYSYTVNLAGTQNEIEFHGGIQQSNVSATLSFPGEPAMTNNIVFV